MAAREEGWRAYWKGNFTNVVRVFPYSAFQLAANDQYKRLFSSGDGSLSVWRRLLAGACAGMTATASTHPLDVVRLRLALPGTQYTGKRERPGSSRRPAMTCVLSSASVMHLQVGHSDGRGQVTGNVSWFAPWARLADFARPGFRSGAWRNCYWPVRMSMGALFDDIRRNAQCHCDDFSD
jgi:Mitochondrial carrier protein